MLRADYDRRADVLYLSKGVPVPATAEQEDDGLLLRRSIATEKPVGVTVFKYRKWAPYTDLLERRIAALLGVAVQETRAALRSVDTEKNA